MLDMISINFCFSLISTPPPERVPIKTHLSSFSEDKVISAIKYELDRGGQVFYVLPRIKGDSQLLISIRTCVCKLMYCPSLKIRPIITLCMTFSLIGQAIVHIHIILVAIIFECSVDRVFICDEKGRMF